MYSSVFGIRLSRAPASPLVAVILLGVLSVGAAWSQPSESAPQDREAIPDLNQLQKRVLEFWSLVTRGQKYQALRYVAEGQDHFLNWKWSPVESYRVANLELKEWISRSGGDGAGRRPSARLREPGQLAGPATMGFPGGHLGDPCRRIEFCGSFRGKEPETGRFQSGSDGRPSKSSGNSGLESGGFISARFCREK